MIKKRPGEFGWQALKSIYASLSYAFFTYSIFWLGDLIRYIFLTHRANLIKYPEDTNYREASSVIIDFYYKYIQIDKICQEVYL